MKMRHTFSLSFQSLFKNMRNFTFRSDLEWYIKLEKKIMKKSNNFTDEILKHSGNPFMLIK